VGQGRRLTLTLRAASLPASRTPDLLPIHSKAILGGRVASCKPLSPCTKRWRVVRGRRGLVSDLPKRRGGGGGRTWSGLRRCKAWPHYPAHRAWLELGSGSTPVGEGRGGEVWRTSGAGAPPPGVDAEEGRRNNS
jgi:hypothetical protein